MGLRPPIVRRSAAPKAPTTERVVRPTPERTEPLRSADQFFQSDKPAAASPKPITPVGDAVSKAYQVFDRYLDEGKAFAAGQSAWYDGQGKGGNAGIAAPTDLNAAALWFVEQMSRLGQTAGGLNLPAPPPPQDWPRPRWPSSSGDAGRWVEETFTDPPTDKK